VDQWVLGALSALVLIGITNLNTSPSQGDQNNSEENPEPKVSKEEKPRKNASRVEIFDPTRDWLRKEVPYVITDEERDAFKELTTEDERKEFIENFWERRNPRPGSPENLYKEWYYQRIIYANEYFGSGIPGWKTDRGRIYITHGPPDMIAFHAGGGPYDHAGSEGGGTVNHPFEEWRYGYIDGVSANIIMEFVDIDMNGEYHLIMDPGAKEALIHAPVPVIRPYSPDYLDLTPEPMWANFPPFHFPFTQIDAYTRILQPPRGMFKDLKAVVTSKLPANLLPFDVRADFIRATDETVLTPITVQVANSDVQFQNKDGVMHGVVDVYGEIANLGGHIVYTIEKGLVLDAPEERFQLHQNRKSTFQEVVPLRPGRYNLSLVLKDELSGRTGTEALGVVVPSFTAEDLRLTHSSLILADQISPLPIHLAGTHPFAIGGTEVRPSVNNTFSDDQTLGIYMQVYNLGIDDTTHKPSLDVRYSIEKEGKLLIDQPEAPANLAKASQQFTVVKRMILKGFAPGKYTAQIEVTDHLKKQTICPSATLEVR
jgi:GWxTD domain-containing protein